MTGPRRKGSSASTLSRRSKATFRLGLRLAARNAARAGGRSALIVVLIALPVIGLAGAGTVALSMAGTVAQTVQARLGGMAAVVSIQDGRVVQTADGQMTNGFGSGRPAAPRSWIPSRWRIVPLQSDQLYLRTAHGVANIDGEAGKTWDKAFAGRFSLLSGRAPTSGNELLVSPSALTRLGTHVGGTIQTAAGTRQYTVVGTMRDKTVPSSSALVFGQFAAFPGLHVTVVGGADFYLAGPSVTWSDVLAFNKHGGLVESRAVTAKLDTPAANTSLNLFAVFGIVAAFMLIEIALLAGAAFMVGARQQQRALAVLASVGADRRVLRTSVAGGGVVLGAAGALAGIGIGLAAAWAYMSLTGDGSITKYYGFDANPLALVVLGLVAVLASWISAAIPARSASRFDVVAALRGARRPIAPSRLRSAIGIVVMILGASLVAVGGALLLVAAPQNPAPSLLQAAGPTLLVIGSLGLQVGAILGLPALLRAVAERMARAGSGARLASRDLARNSSRAVPAIAVIMSTAFVGVFLMAAVSGGESAAAAAYSWNAPLHSTLVQSEGNQDPTEPAPKPVTADTAASYVTEINRVLRTSSARIIQGAPDATIPDPKLIKPGAPAIAEPRLNARAWSAYNEGSNSLPQNLTGYGAGAKLIVASPADLAALLGQKPSITGLKALASGGAVSLYSEYLTYSSVTIDWWTPKQVYGGDNITANKTPARHTTLPAVLDAPAHPGAFGIVISPKTAATLHIEATPRFVLADQQAAPTLAQQDTLRAYIDRQSGVGHQTQADLYVEMGPTRLAGGIAWIIVAIAALSTLGAAVIALGLSRIDGRRDEYTLISVGAKPRTQRLIAFWQALVLAGLGSIIGGAFALVPSAALAYGHVILFTPPWAALFTSVIGVPIVIAIASFVLRRPARSASPDRTLVG